MTYLKMALALLAPVVLAVIFYLLQTKTKFGKLSYWIRQSIIGLAFGIVACLATQYGVPFDGYMMNVRSASPLTAGIFFGGPAGIIAGIIGGAYRWFSVYWGVPMYTRIACSVATVIAGFAGAFCHKYMVHDRKMSYFYGLSVTIPTEIFHMLLVFFTHMDDISTAFSVVKATAIIMISLNTLSVFLTTIIIVLISKEKFNFKKISRPVTQTFALSLVICLILSFSATTCFTNYLQQNISDLQVDNLLTMNVADVKADFQAAADEELLNKTYEIQADFYDYFESPSYVISQNSIYNKYNRSLSKPSYLSQKGVSEINIIGKNGIVLYSSKNENVGFDMHSGEQSQEFLCLLDGSNDSLVQEFQSKSQEPELQLKYAAVSLREIVDIDTIRFEGGFIQVGYDYNKYMGSVKANLNDLANNRHVGQEGFTFILSEIDGELISAPKDAITNELCMEFSKTLSEIEDGKVYSYTNAAGVEYLYLKSRIECYDVVGCIPVSEAEFSRDISIYIGGFMLLISFFVLFYIVFFLLKKLFVDNIHKVNTSLAQITNGNLETKVDIYSNAEFASLSNDINSTVDKLKGYIDEAEKRIDMELQFAKSIQQSVLPSIFPPYPNRKEFDIYAEMITAKEVGGDFYDFNLIDNKLVFLIADVSGKGIPAAMFMMNAKQLIKSLVLTGMSLSDVFIQANDKLCATNETGMFVTAWMGSLDLVSGELRYVNAGHNPPLIKKANGTFEYIKSKHGLVLAGMEGMIYRENSLIMQPGDQIFLYTDGVTEATNSSNELFGEERLQIALNEGANKNANDICLLINKKIDDFVKEAPQFDDITMLSLKYLKKTQEGEKIVKELSLEATVEHIETVTEFVDAELEAIDCPPKTMMQINIAIDELFGNIAHYAYHPGKGNATVRIEVEKDPLSVIITFIDEGVPFDPLEKNDPNISASAEEREIGGLGIFMVKKTMDGIRYEYSDGKNILEIKKNL